MKSISKNVNDNINTNIWAEAEKKFSVEIRTDIKEFLNANAGGYPEKDVIEVDGDEYEVRRFLSLDSSDKNYNISKPLNYFMDKTKAKMVPIGIDSGDNYYCVNNETGKVYYWSASEDSYYFIENDIENFLSLFE